MQLAGKKVLLGITGSISAYKMILLLRMLTAEGAEVKVILTKAATGFVSPLTLSTLSGHPVHTELHDGENWSNHVMLGRWADIILIAPASCNTIAKMAAGLCDNLLMSVYLSAVCPVSIAPAMDEDMWMHEATRTNIRILSSRGVSVLPVGHGALGSGLTGAGRLAEPEEMMAHILEKVNGNSTTAFKGKKVLITAGPTYEAIDPVRFIGNHSSGKMGISLAKAFAEAGAEVTIICGPVSVPLPEQDGIQVFRVTSAAEMLAEVQAHQSAQDWFIMAAAVADYQPEKVSGEKIKKQGEEMVLRLVKTPDILQHLGATKESGQTLVGFALETHNALTYAQEKRERKQADYMVMNEYKPGKTGFGYDTNELAVITRDGSVVNFDFAPKMILARQLVQFFAND